MRPTKKVKDINKCIIVDTNSLQELLECGKTAAVNVGIKAAARIQVGRRVFWNREKIEQYLNSISK